MAVIKRLTFGLLCSLLLFSAAFAAAGADATSGFMIDLPHVAQPPAIDGNLQDAAWQQAAKVTLTQNMRDRTPADQPTTVYVMTDGTYLYVAFEAKQNARIQAAQHTNDVNGYSDDNVSVSLWPNGGNGFYYQFSANPIGTHFQYSTENSAYAPSWASSGKVTANGYSVTMRIPLRSIRAAANHVWRIQFERHVAATSDDYVWAYTPGQEMGTDVVFAGYLSGIAAGKNVRPLPRFGVYGVADLRSQTLGGSTSRMGLDASIPITAQTSFLATVHPDYSNVEQDQQSISPTAFARYFGEVRPFFTQLEQAFNNANGSSYNVQELYTPSIPTPRDAYALEGKQGSFSFAGFQALGVGRSDSAQTIDYTTKDLKTSVAAKRVSVDGSDVCGSSVGVSSLTCFGVPFVHNDDTLFSFSHDTLKGFSEFLNYGTNAGTFVSDPSKARREEAGFQLYDKNSFATASLQQIGSQYSPVDGFVQQTDVAGYRLFAGRHWYRDKANAIVRVGAQLGIGRMHDSTGQLNYSFNRAGLSLALRQQVFMTLETGSRYTRLFDGNFVPVNQNGASISYNYNTSTPTSVSYYTGRYGPSRLDSWSRSTSLKTGSRGSLTLEADNNVQWMDGGAPRNMLWLQRVSYALQNSSNSSVALGVRRIFGASPLLEFPISGTPPASYRACDATGYNACVNQWNLSGAYYKRLPHDEFYLVYGDASQITTQPQVVLKFIHYFGAEKGT